MITRDTIGKYVKRIYVLVQVMAILVMSALFVFGFIEIAVSFEYFRLPYEFLKDLLHSLEVLFIAPIPMLIVFSFRKHIILSFPRNPNALANPFDDDTPRSQLDDVINEDVAKKAFISSIIGVMSTYLLSLFINLLSKANDDVNKDLSLSGDFKIVLVFYLVFLCILIWLYHLISNHKKASHNEVEHLEGEFVRIKPLGGQSVEKEKTH